MRELSLRIWPAPKSAQNLAKCEGAPPLAVGPMLGSRQRLGQADPDTTAYNFSLNSVI